MSAHQAIFPVAVMARVLGVSVSGFHAWRCRPPSAHAIADTVLLKQIRTVHASSRETYGAPRVQAALKAGGEKQPSTTPGASNTCGSTGRGRHLRPVPRPMSLDRLIKLHEAHDGAFDG